MSRAAQRPLRRRQRLLGRSWALMLLSLACARDPQTPRPEATPAAVAEASAPLAPPPAPPPSVLPSDALDDFELRVTRTACFGPCPAYFIQVSSKGKVLGRRRGTGPLLPVRVLSPVELRRLARAFYEAGFFDLKEVYPARATDASSITIELRSGGRFKRVTRDESNASAPVALWELQKLLEEVTGARDFGFDRPRPL